MHQTVGGLITSIFSDTSNETKFLDGAIQLFLVGLLILVNLEVSEGVSVVGGGDNSEEVL